MAGLAALGGVHAMQADDLAIALGTHPAELLKGLSIEGVEIDPK